ncbi:MAG: tetratricopeptide repeat protein [Ginsengibacter sp.]
MNTRILKSFLVLLCTLYLLPEVHAQIGKITIDLQKDKPAKFKAKTLKSEKTGQKKFTVPRRFIQNTVSHYNYFYNANNKLDQVIERARMSNKDNYTKLLPFYGYSLDNTASQKTELDSVIYKATAGILLHDLRSDWVDNLYLLIGEAYYLRKEYDSASMTFQFINYNLYPHKKKDDDQLIVGTNDNASNRAISVSSKEDQNIIHKFFTRPPSRNDAFIWQIRTLIDMDATGDAAGLLNTLQNDPVFPGRLKPALEEMSAYWFYKQQMYDSTLVHLDNSLPNATDLQDKARREFLLAQLYEMTNRQEDASEYYDRAMRNTTDPLMDIYANLNKAKMLKSHDPAEIDKSVATLLRMSKKDKFEPYRDIIFFSAAQLALIKPDTAAAVFLFKKSTFYNMENVSFKNKAFLELAEISYKQKKYKDAYAFYDSLQTDDTTLSNLAQIQERRNALAAIVGHINIIEREDSLQSIAAMSPADRNTFLKKLSKRLKKERGIKEDDANYTNEAATFFNTKNASSNIFGGDNNAKGDWYFYNTSLKSKGYTEFKRTWGKRQNVDNWRRLSTANTLAGPGGRNSNASPDGLDSSASMDPLGQNANAPEVNSMKIVPIDVQTDVSPEGLLANVPDTKEKLDASNSKVSISLFALGKGYQNLLEDYNSAIETYERSLQRFPDSLYAGELYLDLSYCYRKLGDLAKADYYKNLLLHKFEKSRFTQLALHPEAMDPSKKDTAATRRYEKIYDLFIEGDFENAIKDKAQADSVYGANYWSPQLLYIESVYYVRKRDDSTAIKILTQIIDQYPTSPLKPKAATMIDVLKRRSSIENYLTNLTIERAKEDSQIIVYNDPSIIKRALPDTAYINNIKRSNGVITPGKVIIDSAFRAPTTIRNTTFIIDPLAVQNVMMVLTKVDPVYSSEARNAFNRYNREKFYPQVIDITKDTLDKERTLLVFSQFETADEAIKYMDKLKRAAPAEISWLPAGKYSFYIISGTNLDLLKENKNLQSYIDLLSKKYPGKF